MPNRVSSKGRHGVVTYSVLKTFFIFLLSVLFKEVEVVLPHPKGGRIYRWMAKFSRKISYIDDGMDTFRDEPKNIELGLVRGKVNYYSFSDDMPRAKWLANFNVIPICPLKNLAHDDKPPVNMSGYGTLIVESPGVDINGCCLNKGDVLLFSHPNHNKNGKYEKNRLCVSGLDYSLEKTLLNCQGDVIVGESMALVFSLRYLPKECGFFLYLDVAQYANLSCLHQLILKRVNLRLN